jgi:hypothetical protein
MADVLRLRGSDAQIRLVLNNVLQRTITAVRDITWTTKRDILRQGFLGESADRHDDIFRGNAVEFTVEPESKEIFVFERALINRSSRRTAQANVRVDLSVVWQFPNGDRPRITLLDLKFGDTAFSIPGRDQFATGRFQAECDKGQISGID